ncbi:MAG TPA: CHAT domain-containing protein [Pyrinomonadaceae bacterium]|nr:CHAT domain-containing protein [Pyrinomonadaceae bacterium]
MGNIVARQGNEKEAEKYYLSARKRFVKIGDLSELAMSDNSLANTYAELNNFQKAEDFYAKALENARSAKMFVTEAEIEASIGNLALFRGKYADALRFLELSRRKYEELNLPHQTAIANLEIADIYLELNLSEEATAIYENIADEFKNLKMRGEEARTRANFGKSAILSGNFSLAKTELKKAARLYESEENKIGAANVKLALANLEVTQKHYKNALKFALEADELLQKSTNLRLKLSANWFKGEALRNLENFAEAEKILSETYRKSLRQEQKNIAQSSLNSLGKLYLQQNDAQAEKYFKKAVKMIETLRAPLAGEEFRMSFLADKLAPFENLAKIFISQNRFKDAFLTLERSRARTLSETLQNDAVSETKIAPKLSKKFAAVREELNWFYSRLNRAEEDEYSDLQAEIKTREKQIGELMRHIESTKNSVFSANIQRNIDLKKLQNLLGKNRVLIEFVKFENDFSAFVISEKSINFVPNFAKESEVISDLESLHFQFGALRYGAKIRGKFVEELKKRADFYLQNLYRKLFAPLEKFTKDKNLTIIPAASVYYVPFQALHDGANYLIEKRKICYAPSATVWKFLQNKTSRKTENALLMGFADERIPLVNREIEILQKVFPKAKTFTGKNANFEVFTENAGKFDILHLACHGQFRPENPLFSSLHLANGFVTVRDICANKINAEIVTLSACETGLNKIFAGDEILGLARGFLSAGANSLILSLWTVNDEATTELMKEFYLNLQNGNSIAESLQNSQKNFINRGEHPYFWSPFSLIGK